MIYELRKNQGQFQNSKEHLKRCTWHNAKSLSQGLHKFPENENTTFPVICRHQGLTAAGIIRGEFGTDAFSLHYAIYVDTMWPQAGRQDNLAQPSIPNVIS